MTNVTVVSTCERCKRRLEGRLSFSLKNGSARTVRCFRCSMRHVPLIRRSLAASLVIGTIITLLNQGDLILTGQLSAALVWKIPLSYVVPFAVATWGALSNARR